jgi:putative ABC transport system permease protein
VVSFLSIDFIKLVGIAFLIATPISWLLMNTWLQNFAYKIDVEWWVFAFSGSLTLFIALVTVSFHAIKTAVVKPIKSLRTE